MIIGTPKEIKNHEYRVGIVPAGVHAFASRGHEVIIQAGAGKGSGIEDADYVAAVSAGRSEQLELTGPRAITSIRSRLKFANREDEMAALRRMVFGPLGERINKLHGAGLVVGLNGTGDGGDSLIMTRPLEVYLQGLRGRHRFAGGTAAGALFQRSDGAHLPAAKRPFPGAG